MRKILILLILLAGGSWGCARMAALSQWGFICGMTGRGDRLAFNGEVPGFGIVEGAFINGSILTLEAVAGDPELTNREFCFAVHVVHRTPDAEVTTVYVHGPLGVENAQ